LHGGRAHLANGMLTKLIQAAAILVLLTGAAAAQLPMPTFHMGADKPPPTPEELERDKAIDDAYKKSAKKIPDKKPAVDPWGNVRASAPTESKDAAAKNAAAKDTKNTAAKNTAAKNKQQ
jgi:hypothetical protein